MSIEIENVEVFGFETAIRGLRNPMNSWEKSDSKWYSIGAPNTNPAAANDRYLLVKYCIGNNDLDLMIRLCKAGSDHRKFLRMINVTADITAPLYWWKEYDTYKVGTVANSCSTMHTIHAKEFSLDDFSHEHLLIAPQTYESYIPLHIMEDVVEALNEFRKLYLETKDKLYWLQMIQLLPSSYNQRRTVQLNYEVLLNMYHARKTHKLDEWVRFCKWIETLPYFKKICLGDENG